MKRTPWKEASLAAVATAAALLSLAGLTQTSEPGARPPASSASTSFVVPGASFADVIENVSPAVVNIAVRKAALTPTSASPQGRTRAPFDEFFGRYFDAPQGAPFRGVPRQGEGSGFIVDAEGYIATNQHVIDGADEIVVTLASGEQLDARLVGQDSRTDLALIKVEAAADLPALEFGDSDAARVGDWVVAIGNPFGLGGSATAGIISARGRDIQSGPYDDYLQIDAPINSGNSGGPVFNGLGQVIGINTAIFSPNGGNIGIGFAIPSNQARNVIDALKADGSLDRGWLGVEIRTVDEALANALRLDDGSTGALITQVVPGGPADRAGLVPGDVITGLDSEAVTSARDLGRVVGERTAGDTVELSVLRDGSGEEQVDVELGALDSGLVARNRFERR
jgi:serine protease Do